MVEKFFKNKTVIRIGMVIAFSGLTLGGFFLARDLVSNIFRYLVESGTVDISGVNIAVLNTVVALICYIVALTIAIGLPWVIFNKRTTLRDIGLHRLPSWSEIGLAPIGFVVYMIASMLVMFSIIQLIPGFDIKEAQETGFGNITQRYEYVVAFFTLVVLAPVAEEVLFRGYLYGRLKRWAPWVVSALITSVLFGFAHGQWNVGIDTFVMSMIACMLRDICGSLWPAIMLHMIKNGIAYYFLFVNPIIGS